MVTHQVAFSMKNIEEHCTLENFSLNNLYFKTNLINLEFMLNLVVTITSGLIQNSVLEPLKEYYYF